MAFERNADIGAQMARRHRLKGVFAAVIIVACIVFVTWAVWPKPPLVIPPQTDSVAQWEASFAAINQEHAAKIDAMYKMLGKIAVQPSEDRQSMVVTGKVSSVAELNAIKAELAKVQPALPLVWQVTIGL